MTSRTLVSGIVLASALLSAGAMAQTGQPSEAPTSIARSSVIDTNQDPAGSYARYLMLNGATRDVALRTAQTIDHPAPRPFKAAWLRVRGDKSTPAPTQAPAN
jgi:hypothetical protein